MSDDADNLTRRRRWVSAVRRTLAGLLVAVVLASFAGLPVYVFPQVDPLRRADAILVLGGYGYLRYRLGFQLADQQAAPNLVISNPNGPADPFLWKKCAESQPEYRLICFNPDPDTTRGEGRELRRLADENSWNSVIVVTSRPHISRARFVLRRCFAGELIMVDSGAPIPLHRWPFEYAYQTAGYIRAVRDSGC